MHTVTWTPSVVPPNDEDANYLGAWVEGPGDASYILLYWSRQLGFYDFDADAKERPRNRIHCYVKLTPPEPADAARPEEAA